MPPTMPVLGRPCVAVVFAQLVVGGERRGIRPFIVRMNDGYYMSKGITARSAIFVY
jgi:acyl-CoA oxidase